MATAKNYKLSSNSTCVKVKDKNGVIVKGLFRSPGGGLVVNDKEAYERYMREKNSIEKMKSMEEEIEQLKAMVHALLNKDK